MWVSKPNPFVDGEPNKFGMSEVVLAGVVEIVPDSKCTVQFFAKEIDLNE